MIFIFNRVVFIEFSEIEYLSLWFATKLFFTETKWRVNSIAFMFVGD